MERNQPVFKVHLITKENNISVYPLLGVSTLKNNMHEKVYHRGTKSTIFKLGVSKIIEDRGCWKPLGDLGDLKQFTQVNE